MMQAVSVVLYLLLAPFAGALLDGMDRKISARMQGRQGPPLLQPFYDLAKLFSKQMLAVNNVQIFLLLSYLIFLAVSGSLLFAGADILMCPCPRRICSWSWRPPATRRPSRRWAPAAR